MKMKRLEVSIARARSRSAVGVFGIGEVALFLRGGRALAEEGEKQEVEAVFG